MSRIDRISEEVMRAVSETLRTVKDPRIQGLVSVTHCQVTPDLKYAKVYVSVLGEDVNRREVMKGLFSAAGYVRRELGRKVQLRVLPEVSFVMDDSIAKGAKITKILSDLDREKGGEA